MHHDQPSWLHRLAWRRFVVISGWLAWLVGSDFLKTSRNVVTEPSWQPSITHPRFVDGLFVLLLLYGLGWIAGSLMALRALARRPELRARIEAQWWAEPILLQIITFGEHWIMGMFYVFATGDINRGAILGLLSGLHVLVVLLVGPAWVKRAVKQGTNEVTKQHHD